jgi:hypothetical protein
VLAGRHWQDVMTVDAKESGRSSIRGLSLCGALRRLAEAIYLLETLTLFTEGLKVEITDIKHRKDSNEYVYIVFNSHRLSRS